MEDIVFANTPLADYLEASGEGSSFFHRSTSPAPSDRESNNYAPAFLSSVRSGRLPQLRLSENGPEISLWDYLLSLIASVLDAKLSSRENERFLERFRYIIVASQLLNGHVNVSHYDAVPDEADAPALPLRVRISSLHAILAGVSSTLLFWIICGYGRTLSSVLLLAVVGIFVYTSAKQKWLRSVRSKALEFSASFVENSQSFDILASNAVTLIQEVELVSRGYRLSTPLPPISRLERDTQHRRCARLRKTILEASKSVIPPHTGACLSLRHMVQGPDLERYYDIYDVCLTDLEEAEQGYESDEFEDAESLKSLKTLLHRLHTIRRVFLCSLMAIDASGGTSDTTKWGLAVDQLRALGGMMGSQSSLLKRILEQEERPPSLPPSPSPGSPKNEKHRTQLRKLNSLSQSLRGLQAKMHVLREESDRTLRESLGEGRGSELLQVYDSVGADLRSLVDEWEAGRAFLVLNLGLAENDDDGKTLVSDTPRGSGLFEAGEMAFLSTIGEGAADGRLSAAAALAGCRESFEEKEVFEAVAEPRRRSWNSGVGREERIRRVQEERKREADRRQSREAGVALQLELKNVLGSRPGVGRRMSGGIKRFGTASLGGAGIERVERATSLGAGIERMERATSLGAGIERVERATSLGQEVDGGGGG